LEFDSSKTNSLVRTIGIPKDKIKLKTVANEIITINNPKVDCELFRVNDGIRIKGINA
jgi:hypothetical protein